MSSKGTIFDIQRFSLHDGPGIRTTVFLKGCPLQCKWCHNPESQSPEHQLSFDQKKCVDCMACVRVCPTRAHQDREGKHVLDHDLCDLYGECVKACAYGALKIYGREMDVEEILEEVKKDRNYYNNSGGGLTLSGGEPMFQFEFCRELLQKAHKEGIHTCLETCGFTPQAQFEQILDVVDLFLYDYKVTDSLRHQHFTGVSNELILKNLDFLYKRSAGIILRCPLIPGVNDLDSHLKGIAELCQNYPGLEGLEIMAYHNMGNNKAVQIGQEISLPGIDNTTEETKAEWLKKLKEYGCGKVSLG